MEVKTMVIAIIYNTDFNLGRNFEISSYKYKYVTISIEFL